MLEGKLEMDNPTDKLDNQDASVRSESGENRHLDESEAKRIKVDEEGEDAPNGQARKDNIIIVEHAALDEVDKLFASWSGGWTPQNVKEREWQLAAPIDSDEISSSENRKDQYFPNWDRNDFRVFLKACVEKGKDALQDIVLELPDKTVEEVTRYAKAFWSLGHECFTAENWAAIIHVIGQGHRSKEEAEKELVMNEVQKKLQDNKRLEFHRSLKPLLGMEFCEDEDRFLLKCYLDHLSKEEIHELVLESPAFAFDHFFRGLSCDDLERRQSTLIDIVKKDIEEGIKAEEKALRDKERREQEDNALLKKEQDLIARIEEMERMILQGTYQSPGGTSIAAEASHKHPQIYSDHLSEQPIQNNGASPVSPSAAPTGDVDGDNDSDAGNSGPILEPKYIEPVLNMVINSGTCGMAQLVDKVTRILPEGLISKRQLRREIQRLAVKEKRAGDRAARWYPKEVDSL